MRSNPLNNTREPRMGRMAWVPIVAAAILVSDGLAAHKLNEQQRMRAVASAVIATGRAGPVKVEPIRSDECWRAREGFRWTTGTEEGWACAGPRDEVTIREAHPITRG